MTRFIYGGGGDGDIIQPSGVPFANATALVYNARTGGTRITDLQTISGAAVSAATTDLYGQAIFYGPDAYIGVLWLDFGVGPRWALSPKAVDLASAQAIAVQRAADFTGAAFTVKAALPYNANDPLEQALANKLDPMVIPRFASQTARNAAFPAPANGDRCWRTDLSAEQVYNGSTSTWRTTSFASDTGTTGSAVTLNATATETALSTLSLPGNLPAGATFRVTAFGTISEAASTAPTISFRLRIGGVSGTYLTGAGVVGFNTATPMQGSWQFQGLVTVASIGVTGTWVGNTTVTTDFASWGVNRTTSPYTNSSDPVTRDTTISQTLAMTAQWSASSTFNSLTQYGWFWERVC